MKVKIFFRASHRRIGAARLYALASPYKIASYGPAQNRHPPFTIPRSAPAACRPRLPLTQPMLNNFPPGCPPLQKKLCTALIATSKCGCGCKQMAGVHQLALNLHSLHLSFQEVGIKKCPEWIPGRSAVSIVS